MDEVTDFAKERLWPMVSRWGQDRLTGADLPAADEVLIGCYHYDVRWDFLVTVFLSESSGMDVSSDTYWGPLGPDGKKAPRSVLAFLGLAARLRIAADPATPLDKLDLMAGDWDRTVRDSVFATGRMPADDPRSRWKNLTNAEAREVLSAQIAAQHEKWRRTEHEHEYCLYPFSDVRECSKCGIEYEPYDHPHDWFEWGGDYECRICGTVRGA